VTLPVVGTTDGAQAANQSVAATAAADGSITFVGPSGIQGSTITCVVTVPNAPAGATFTAILGTPAGQGVIVDTWGGDSTAGQFQILVGQTLVVQGEGMGAGLGTFTCTFAAVTDVGDVQVVIPEPNSSALTATVFAAGIGTEVFTSPGVPVTSGTTVIIASVPLTSSTRTLIISIGGGIFPTLVQVIGNDTTFIYYNQPPYLITIDGALIICDVAGVADQSVEVIIVGPGGTTSIPVTIWTDTAQYDESILYNGTAKAISAQENTNGTFTVLSGPVRLISASLEQAAGGSAIFGLSTGGVILRSDNPAGQPTASLVVSFPPNTIVPNGESLVLIVFGGAVYSIVGAVYAYP